MDTLLDKIECGNDHNLPLDELLTNEKVEEEKLLAHINEKRKYLEIDKTTTNKSNLFDSAKKDFSTILGVVEELTTTYDDATIKMKIINRDTNLSANKFIKEINETLSRNQEIMSGMKNDLRHLYTKLTALMATPNI